MSSNKTCKSKATGGSRCGGGFGCCRGKATDISQPSPKSKAPSPSRQEPTRAEEEVSATGGTLPKINESIVVVGYSDDPYHDFRQSMLQMIRERDIRSSDDLQQLLDCLLELNPPHHHDIIVRAFKGICNGGGNAAAPAAV